METNKLFDEVESRRDTSNMVLVGGGTESSTGVISWANGTTLSSGGWNVQEVKKKKFLGITWWKKITEISRGLKALARELNIPVLAISQLSRAVEQRSPQIPRLADLRESGSLEQDADVVMFIYREDHYNRNTERKNIADIIIAKHRNGPTGVIELFFNDNFVSFQNLEKRYEE